MLRIRICTLALGSVLLLGYAGFECALSLLPMPDLSRTTGVSPMVLAEDGRILTSYLTKDGKWRFRSTSDDVSEQYLQMLIAYEDKRFFTHGGVDPLAVFRAIYQFALHGRALSGASTITMQTVRLCCVKGSGFLAKLRQALFAIKLERQLDKQSILAAYLTLAPFGGNIEGVRAASLQYFGKEPRMLSTAETAYLVALPQAPERRRPGSSASGGRDGRDKVLRRARDAGLLSAREATQARDESIPSSRGHYPTLAHHLSDRLHNARKEELSIKTLIDYDLQRKLEALSTEAVVGQAEPVNIAVLVIRNSDLAVRSYIGGASYFDASRAGMFDLVRGIRSPGSTLKPFIYGFAFEDLIVHPDTIVTDDVVRIHGYAPTNFDNTFRGDLTVKRALIQSINTIAVTLLQDVGPDRFLMRMRDAGIKINMPDDSPPGLAIALGGLGMSLEQLTGLYAGIANGGMVGALRFRMDSPAVKRQRLVREDANWAVMDALADSAAPQGRLPMRAQDGGRRIAFKTGTSYGFRDAWALGFDANYTVAVWIGRPDGNGRMAETGMQVSVPIMMRIFDLLPNAQHDVAQNRPTHSILAEDSGLPTRLVRSVFAPHPFQFQFPQNGSTVKLEQRGKSYLPLGISIVGGQPPYRWYVDGKAMDEQVAGSKFAWTPKSKGQVEFVTVDADGRKASSTVWLF